jgi:O-antigen/teichoic acid export membrane protein
VIMNFLGGEGNPPIVVWAPLVGLVLNLGANLFVIPRWGIEGAAVTSSIGYGLVLILVLVYHLRSSGSRVRDVALVRTSDVAALRGSRSGARAPAAA